MTMMTAMITTVTTLMIIKKHYV